MVTAHDERIGIGTAEIDALLTRGGLVQGADGGVWIGWGGVEQRPAPEFGRLSIYAPNFFLRDARPWRVFERSSRLDPDELIALLDRFAVPAPRSDWRVSPYAAFEAAFADIQRRIAEGSLVKAVPFIARTARLNLDAPRRAAILAHVLRARRGSSLLTYGLWDENEGMIGATPETLFQERPRLGAPPSLATMALAGTRTPQSPSLLDDPKEMHEHRVVVEGLVERLSPLGRVAVGTTEELRLPNLIHLHTPIEAFPDRRVGFDEWVAALHPTAAIGAWPKAEGWRWLLEQPNADERSRYGAPFGVVPPDATTGTCLVAIRNLQWEGDSARLLAGGGIVAASRAEREWREFNAKLDAIQGALGL